MVQKCFLNKSTTTGATWCSIYFCKWLEYLLWLLGKHFIRQKHIKIFKMVQKSNKKLSQKKLQHMTINFHSYIHIQGQYFYTTGFFFNSFYCWTFANCINREELTLFLCSVSIETDIREQVQKENTNICGLQ